MKKTILAGAVAVGSLLFGARDAHALGPIDLEVGLKAGVGTNPSDGANPYGFGIGGRGGVAISGFYGGVNVIYYTGSSQSVSSGLGSVDVSQHSLLYGVELGYGWKLLDLVTIRPQLGLGNATYTASAGDVSNSSSHLYLEPAVVGLISLGIIYVGADLGALIVPGVDVGTETKTYTSMTVHGQLGLTF